MAGQQGRAAFSPNAIVDAMIRAQQMDDQAAYLSRGRRHRDPDASQVQTLWAEAFRTWFQGRPKTPMTAMNDLEAELRLRGLKPDYEAVRCHLDVLQDEFAQDDPENEGVLQAVRAYRLRTARGDA